MEVATGKGWTSSSRYYEYHFFGLVVIKGSYRSTSAPQQKQGSCFACAVLEGLWLRQRSAVLWLQYGNQTQSGCAEGYFP